MFNKKNLRPVFNVSVVNLEAECITVADLLIKLILLDERQSGWYLCGSLLARTQRCVSAERVTWQSREFAK